MSNVRVVYREQADPVMARIQSVLGDVGIALWQERQVAAVQALFETDPAAAISGDQFMEIARDTCPQRRSDVAAERDDGEERGGLDVRDNRIVSAILAATAGGGTLSLAQFSAIILKAGELAEAEINGAMRRAGWSKIRRATGEGMN